MLLWVEIAQWNEVLVVFYYNLECPDIAIPYIISFFWLFLILLGHPEDSLLSMRLSESLSLLNFLRCVYPSPLVG